MNGAYAFGLSSPGRAVGAFSACYFPRGGSRPPAPFDLSKRAGEQIAGRTRRSIMKYLLLLHTPGGAPADQRSAEYADWAGGRSCSWPGPTCCAGWAARPTPATHTARR
jgi:hypothetical protein